MKAARFAAVGIVVAAVGWIASGHLFPHESSESRAAARPAEAETAKLFRVAVMSANVVPSTKAT
jgi:multidrug efflux system membrane fusion protein